MKILCVRLPHFPLRCEIKDDPALEDCPVIVTYASRSEKRVLDYSPELHGLRAGMTLQSALALYGQVRLIQADETRYRAVFNGLLDALERKSPLVEGSESDCAYLGLDGLQLIYPTDETLITGVRETVPEVFAPQLGIAGNKFLAYLAALYSPPGGYRVLEGDAAVFLSNLPCDVLPVSARIKSQLHDFGLHTMGQVASLAPGPLQSQFGLAGKKIYELTRGCDDTPFYPRRWEETIEESTTLSSVTVSLEVTLITVESLLARIFARECLKGKGIRHITLWTKSTDAGRWEHNIRFRELAMDVKSTVSRIKFTFERYPQSGPVEEIGIKVTGLGYRKGRQQNLFAEVKAKDHLLYEIKQLELRLGRPKIFRIKEVEPWSRIPERRYVLAPVNQ